MAFNEDSSGSGHDEPWIQWFCGLKGHEMFCEVERSYIEDGFNLYGLRACVSNFSDCLDLILDRIGPDDSDDSHLTQSACTLYGLIHARYIITAHGLDAMYNKYAAKEFGTCPLAQCAGQPVLPVGLKDEMGADTVKIFCPKCQCVYHPPPIRSRSSSHHGAGAAGVDGAAFGTTFPHLFLMTFSNLVPDPLPPNSAYVPRVFGFRVHMSARQRAPSANAAISADVASAKSAAKVSRLTYSRKSTSQGGNGGGSGKNSDVRSKDRDNDKGDAKTKDAQIPPSSKSPAPGAVSASTGALAEPPSLAVAAATETVKVAEKDASPTTNAAAAKPDSSEEASAAAGNKNRSIADASLSSLAAGGKRPVDGTDGVNNSDGRKAEGNGFLVDNNAAKRRKRNDTASG